MQAQSSGFPLLTLLSPLLGRLSFLSAWIWNTGCFVICFSGERVSSGEEDTLGSQLRPQRLVQGGHGVNAQQRSGGMSPLPLLCYQRLGQSFRLRGYPDWGACPHPGSRVPGHQLLVQMTSFALLFPSCKWAGGWRKPLRGPPRFKCSKAVPWPPRWLSSRETRRALIPGTRARDLI